MTFQKDVQLEAEKNQNCQLMQNLKATRRKLEELKEDKEKMEQHLFGQFFSSQKRSELFLRLTK